MSKPTQIATIALLMLFGTLLLGTPLSAQGLLYSCDEFGLEAALLAGGGPHTFNCTQPTLLR
jgi:hypothetical protein